MHIIYSQTRTFTPKKSPLPGIAGAILLLVIICAAINDSNKTSSSPTAKDPTQTPVAPSPLGSADDRTNDPAAEPAPHYYYHYNHGEPPQIDPAK